MATNEAKQEKIILDPIRSKESWAVLRKLMEEQKGNETMPQELRDLFFSDDGSKVLEFTMSPNCVLVALATSRIQYEGDKLGLESMGGEAITDAPAQG